MAMLTVVVTGSESTGKSTLAALLARRFGAALSAEFAREYADRHHGSLDASDVEPIAKGQLTAEMAAERQAVEHGNRVVIRDTDLFSTVVYSRHYYGTCPTWIQEAAARRAGDLYLLLSPDVPWIADGVRDRPEPADRARLHASFQATLASAGVHVVEISGGWTTRDAAAIEAVSRALDAVARRSGPKRCTGNPS